MEKEEQKPQGTEVKTFTQDMVNEIIAKEVLKAKGELGSKLSAEQKRIAEYEEKIKELENTVVAKSSVDELKTTFSAKEKKYKEQEDKLLKEKEALINKYNTEKMEKTYTKLVTESIDYEHDLVIEHLMNHSKLSDEGQIVYVNKDGDELTPEKAIEKIVNSRPALKAGSPSGTGLRPGRPITPKTDKKNWTSKDYFAEAEKIAASRK